MICTACGKVDELRLGVCFDCAMSGEARAAKRTVLQHLQKAATNVRRRKWLYAWYDVTWAWQRLTRTGDYSRGGYFDLESLDWKVHG